MKKSQQDSGCKGLGSVLRESVTKERENQQQNNSRPSVIMHAKNIEPAIKERGNQQQNSSRPSVIMYAKSMR